MIRSATQLYIGLFGCLQKTHTCHVKQNCVAAMELSIFRAQASSLAHILFNDNYLIQKYFGGVLFHKTRIAIELDRQNKENGKDEKN